MSWTRFMSAAGIAALLLLSATTVEAQAIKIAWDPSPDSRAVGYMVFVGTAPGAPTSSFDVGNGTSFVFAPPQPGVTFYFSVASYGTNHAAGEHSPEVSATADDGGPWALAAPSSPRSVSPARVDGLASPLCADDGRCYTPAAIVTGAGMVTAIAATADQRTLYVEDGRFIKTVPAGGGSATTLLDTGGDPRLVSLALDPSFATTGRAFTAELVPARTGTELVLARYRNVGDEFGERAVVDAGLSATDAVPPLTVDTAGHVFLAVPTPPDSAPRSPYDGMVLRLNSDGTVPGDNPLASPVFTQGYDVPTALVDDPPHATVLVAGYSGPGGTQLRRAATGEIPSGSTTSIALLGRNGVVVLATPQTDGSYRTSTLDLSAVGTPSAVASGDGSLVVALRMPDGQTTILRLMPESPSGPQ